jgi:hypothetical protein
LRGAQDRSSTTVRILVRIVGVHSFSQITSQKVVIVIIFCPLHDLCITHFALEMRSLRVGILFIYWHVRVKA